jgi:multiple sugar transport system permease protein
LLFSYPSPVPNSSSQLKTDAAGWLWISPWLIGFLAFLALPLAMSFYYSFTDYPLVESPLWIGLDNYKALLHDELFLKAAAKTALYASLSIPACTILALVIASLLTARVRAEGFFQAAVFLPTLVPMSASAMIWLWLFNQQNGVLNKIVTTLGLPQVNWLGKDGWVMAALVIVSLWGIGQMVIVYLAAMKEVPIHLYEAAALDGMGPVRRFLNVTLPMISPVILFNVVTLTIGAVQVFTIPFVLTKATPGGDPHSMYFYTSAMYDNAFVYAKMGYASAQAWIQFLVVLLLTGLTFLFSRGYVHYRAG